MTAMCSKSQCHIDVCGLTVENQWCSQAIGKTSKLYYRSVNIDMEQSPLACIILLVFFQNIIHVVGLVIAHATSDYSMFLRDDTFN